ncbi:hypothetical protein [Paenibacillus solani]|nr:hypothetical protein [Paenibacillus solani]
MRRSVGSGLVAERLSRSILLGGGGHAHDGLSAGEHVMCATVS